MLLILKIGNLGHKASYGEKQNILKHVELNPGSPTLSMGKKATKSFKGNPQKLLGIHNPLSSTLYVVLHLAIRAELLVSMFYTSQKPLCHGTDVPVWSITH